ncbi:hypothetical protein NEIPOLOT_01452 [Neisseria polysaccharea ATCC 43768]|nr:hypothetical protein NEIPOLOT_01452 [Neisseria polysaccharea ATCC 43768]
MWKLYLIIKTIPKKFWGAKLSDCYSGLTKIRTRRRSRRQYK